MIVRPIQAGDWPGIDRIQRACFPPTAIESVQSLRSIADASPQLCAAAVEAKAVSGYLLAHPWFDEDLPPLNESLAALPADARCVFIHDLAILPAARGEGLASRMVKPMLITAREAGLTGASLLSVQKTTSFWARFGFVTRPELTERFRERVHGFYEIEFHFMTAELG